MKSGAFPPAPMKSDLPMQAFQSLCMIPHNWWDHSTMNDLSLHGHGCLPNMMSSQIAMHHFTRAGLFFSGLIVQDSVRMVLFTHPSLYLHGCLQLPLAPCWRTHTGFSATIIGCNHQGADRPGTMVPPIPLHTGFTEPQRLKV